jgi:GNAT superfamily N-acetyltransferase
MALKLIDHGSKEYQQMVELRYHILRKPLGLAFTMEELEKEKNEILIGCFDEEKLEGCCMLKDEGDKTVRLLMMFAENIARDRGYKRLTMHARGTAVGFYEKLGYNICSDEFFEVTIPHYIMEKNL